MKGLTGIPGAEASSLSRAPTSVAARSRELLGILFIAAGAMHFISPELYLAMMPPFLPEPAALVFLSGLAEIAGGSGIFWPRTRKLAGLGLIALLIAVFPANIYAAVHGMQIGGRSIPLWILWARLPLQPLLIAWVYFACWKERNLLDDHCMTANRQNPWIEIAPGIRRRTITTGASMYQMRAELEAGSRMPEHSHPQEQIVHIIKGRMRLLCAGAAHELTAGESFYLASNVPHGVETIEDTVVLDTFSPPREDYLALDKQAGVGA